MGSSRRRFLHDSLGRGRRARTGNQMLTLHPSNGPYTVRELALAGSATASVTRTVKFSADGGQVALTTTTYAATGTRIQVATWDGSPKR